MNHPTNEVDDLYEYAQEAIACEDYEQAVMFLRKALEQAPLRKDIRRALADALSRGTHEVTSTSAGSSTSTRASANPSNVATATVAQQTEAVPKTSWMRPPLPKATPAPAPAARTYAAPTHGSLSLALDEEEDAPDLDFPELNLDAATDPGLENLDAVPSRKAPRKAPAKRIVGQKDFEDLLADGIEVVGRLFSPSNRPRLLHGAGYVATFLFVVVACYQVKQQFGPDLARAAAMKPVAISPAETARPRLMLGSTGGADTMASIPVANQVDDSSYLADARAKFARKEFSAAIGVLEPVFQKGIRTPARDEIRAVLAASYDGLATNQLQSAEFEKAIQHYREAVKLLPADTSYRLHLANALYYSGSASTKNRQKTVTEAIQIASDVIAAEATNVNAYQVHARSHQLLGKKPDAAKAWNKVLSLAPRNSRAAREAQTELAKLPKAT